MVRLIVEKTTQEKPHNATHKHAKLKSWLKRHKRFHLHFTPTSSPWLDLVERWFGEITEQRIRRGVFKSVKQLTTAIHSYIEGHNQNPTKFTWTAKAEKILEKIRRAGKTLENVEQSEALRQGYWTKQAQQSDAHPCRAPTGVHSAKSPVISDGARRVGRS